MAGTPKAPTPQGWAPVPSFLLAGTSEVPIPQGWAPILSFFVAGTRGYENE